MNKKWHKGLFSMEKMVFLYSRLTLIRDCKRKKEENDNLITGRWSAANVAPRTNKKPQDLVTCLNEQRQIWIWTPLRYDRPKVCPINLEVLTPPFYKHVLFTKCIQPDGDESKGSQQRSIWCYLCLKWNQQWQPQAHDRKLTLQHVDKNKVSLNHVTHQPSASATAATPLLTD